MARVSARHCLSAEATPAVPAVVATYSVAGYTGYFYGRFRVSRGKSRTTRGREFWEFGRRSSAGMNFGPPAAEL